MSSISKSAKSRRKRQRGSDRKIAVDFISVQFLHQMAGGETGFNLAELTLPAGSGSFLNPSPATVAAASNNMRTKLRLFNGAGKRLALGQEYEVVGTQVNFTNIEAGVDEIFFGDIQDIPRTGADFLDGEVKSATGFLVPGETTFNTGFEYRIGDKISSTNRKGPLQVERNRLTQYVNTSFEAVGPAEDGDYAHVRAGDTAFGTVIEFNSPGTILPSGFPEFISVETRQIIVDRNNLSLRNELQSQQASLVRMAEELGIIQSLDPNIFFQGSPTAVQLKQFGDLLLSLDRKFDTALLLSEFTKTKWQRKDMSMDNQVSDMDFDNLENGKTYALTIYLRHQGISSQDPIVQVSGPGIPEADFFSNQGVGAAWTSSDTNQPRSGYRVVFTALDDGSVGFVHNGSGTIFSASFAILEELPNHVVTTEWT